MAQLEQQFAVSAAPQASLTVAASSTIGNYVLPRLLASFEREQPGVRVNASIGNTGSAVQDVVTFAADIGLIEGPCHEPGLRVEPWLEDSLIVVAAPGHPLALRTQVSREALRRARWLLREPGSGTREEVSHALLGHLHYLEDSLDLGSSEAIKHSVAAGLGISCLSRWVVGTVGLRRAGRTAQQPAAVAPALLHAAPARQVPLAGLRAFLGTLSGGSRRRLAGFRQKNPPAAPDARRGMKRSQERPSV